MITSAIKKQTSVYCSVSLNPYYMVFLKLGITDKKSKKESNSIVSLLLMSAALPIALLYANIVFEIELQIILSFFELNYALVCHFGISQTKLIVVKR